jgi:succinate dehydrogenase / fumarate reductase flavoprotein subunit
LLVQVLQVAAAATLAELGYNVKSFCFSRFTLVKALYCCTRGINAAKNYQGDGDSTFPLIYDVELPRTKTHRLH